jgi:hypothetical protein
MGNTEAAVREIIEISNSITQKEMSPEYLLL